jgi:hypothetical protein
MLDDDTEDNQRYELDCLLNFSGISDNYGDSIAS